MGQAPEHEEVHSAPQEQRRDYAKQTTFRSQPRPLTLAEAHLVERVKQKADELEALFNEARRGRYHALAMTHLEVAVMWMVKEITT